MAVPLHRCSAQGLLRVHVPSTHDTKATTLTRSRTKTKTLRHIKLSLTSAVNLPEKAIRGGAAFPRSLSMSYGSTRQSAPGTAPRSPPG